MTLIVTAAAGLAAGAIRLAKPAVGIAWRVGALALMYLGAALMWCVDGIAGLVQGEGFIELHDGAAMRDDALLGLVVVGLGLAIWAILVVSRRHPGRSR
ncbi:MAG: hypothetical protein LBR19_08400 [Bifidobacteriaceae bacterium]|jgi:hypothetical protein|nr:hypothetical protein [Bifidobacteriaceae bacterium]